MASPAELPPCDLLVVGGGINGAGIARDAAGRGLSVVLVEQFVHRALAFADRAVILQRGRIGWEGSAAAAGPAPLKQAP